MDALCIAAETARPEAPAPLIGSKLKPVLLDQRGLC